MRRALKGDGLLIAALIGGETLTELRQSLTIAESEILGGASPRVAPFVDVRALGGLAQRAGLALPVVDLDRAIVRYPNMFALLADLRAMGATNALHARSLKPLRRGALERAADVYADRFADPDGRLRATFDIVWLSGWAPHESQPKPLEPGSAQKRLADALKPALRRGRGLEAAAPDGVENCVGGWGPTEGLGVGADGGEAARIAVLGKPAVLAATQSFQSLECLFLSRFTPGKPSPGMVYAGASRAANRLRVPRRVSSLARRLRAFDAAARI